MGSDPFNPADAIASQAAFMCKLLAAVTGDQQLTGNPLDLALAAYNAGLGAVQRYHGIPPYPETQAYVRRIRALEVNYANQAGSAPEPSHPAPGAVPSSGQSPPASASTAATCTLASTSANVRTEPW